MKRLVRIAITVLSLLAAAPAHAGSYDVKACYSVPGGGSIGNGSWAAEAPGPYVTAYTDCPGDGIVTRMSGGEGTAPYTASARHVFTAPEGAAVVRFRGNVKVDGRNGWYGGFVDTTPQWIWCGTGCSSWGQHWGFDVGMATAQLSAQVTCGNPGGCPRSALDGIMALKDVIVTVNEGIPPAVAITGGSVTAGGWRSGNQDVHYSASDPTGIRGVEVFVDGQLRGVAGGSCNDWSARPCEDAGGGFPLLGQYFAGDGQHTVTLRAVDAAGNAQVATRDVRIDHAAPAQPINALLLGADAWRSTNLFTLQWRNPGQTAAPIGGVRYTICPVRDPRAACAPSEQRARSIQSLVDLKVPGPGEWRVKLWLEDEAGNADPERSVTVSGLRFDDTPPELAFEEPSSSNPTRISVRASDKTSGIGEASIEVKRRRENAWRSLATAITPDGFSASLDDETMPKGSYELRARAKDLAGNERSTQDQLDGQPATRALPLRIRTRLTVGKLKRVRTRRARGKYRTILVVRPRARYGLTIPLTGRLTTPGANPLAGANVEVWRRVKLPSAIWQRIGQVKTTRTGRFRFKALRGPSRTLRFRYPGTATIRATSKEVDLRVRAVTSLKVTQARVVNGEEIRFHGRLKGRQYGETGKLIHLQVYTRGRWSTFATPRANRATGAWSLPYRFTATRGRVRYRFRAVVPRETSFPYETGVSRSVPVTVRGQ